ncbi:protein PROCA1 [Microcaecilia unicolor]|uniref:Protein PROCA1 n=1 Tax=Microcaecilia unicolor TaxID=1415580 RepID=A0A6P7ZVC0_9AMPH|nr:protein PROCA1 [Microcaecilia unicolor]
MVLKPALLIFWGIFLLCLFWPAARQLDTETRLNGWECSLSSFLPTPTQQVSDGQELVTLTLDGGRQLLALRKCLRKVNDISSRAVGQAFFNVIQVPCFQFQYKDKCTERYWYGWCKRYDKVMLAVPQDPELYDFGGDIIDLPISQQKNPAPESITAFPQLITGIQVLIPAPEQPTFREITQATKNLLKLMVSVSPSTFTDDKNKKHTKKLRKNMEKKNRKN